MNAIGMPDPRLKPAKPAEIVEAVRLLCNSLRPPEGSDLETVMAGYGVALSGYPRWAIANAARKFVRGEIAGQSLAFCPRAPELGAAVRAEMEPVYRDIERAERKTRQRIDAASFRPVAVRTPEERTKARALLDAFHRSNAEARKSAGIGPARQVEQRVALDAKLAAEVPDAPTTWERLAWEERGGDRGEQ